MKEKKRIFGYDALKVLAMFLLVYYHTGMIDIGFREGVYYYPTPIHLISLLYVCGVPMFFMVNGALTVGRGYSLKKTASKVLRCICIGYFWGLCMQTLLILRHHSLSIDTIGSFLSQYTLYNNYFWFMYTLGILYVVSFVLGKLPIWCRCCVVAFLLIFPFGTNLVWDFIILKNPAVSMPKWGHIGFFTLYSVVYLYVGHYLAHHNVNKWLIVLSAIVGYGLVILETIAVTNYHHTQFDGASYCCPTYGALLLTIAVFVWVKDWNLRDGFLKRYISFLGDNTLGIYIFHLLLLATMGTLFPQIKGITLNPLFVVIIVLVNMTLSACISEALRRTPLRFLIKL